MGPDGSLPRAGPGPCGASVKAFLSGLALGLLGVLLWYLIVPPPPLPADPFAAAAEGTVPAVLPPGEEGVIEAPARDPAGQLVSTFVLRSPLGWPMGEVVFWVFRGDRLLAHDWTDAGGYFECEGPPGPARVLVFPEGWVPKLLEVELLGGLADLFLPYSPDLAVLVEVLGHPARPTASPTAEVPDFERTWATLPVPVLESLSSLGVRPDRVAFAPEAGGLHVLRGIPEGEGARVSPPPEFEWESPGGAGVAFLDLAAGEDPLLVRARIRSALRGRVVRPGTNRGVAYALVQGGGRTVLADAEGRFVFPADDRPGRLLVADERGSARAGYEVPASVEDLGDLPLAVVRELRVQVVDDSGRPVRGAACVLDPEAAEESPHWPRSDLTGELTVALAPGPGELRVLARGFGPRVVPVGAEEKSVLVRLEPETSLRVVVEGPMVLGGLRLRLRAQRLFRADSQAWRLDEARISPGRLLGRREGPEGEELEALLPPAGTLVLRNLEASALLSLELLAHGTGALCERREVLLPPLRESRLLLDPGAGARRELCLVDPEGRALPGARVSLAASSAQEPAGEPVWTGPDGRLRLPEDLSAPVRLAILAPGSRWPVPMVLGPADLEAGRCVIPPSRRLELLVVDAAGDPAAIEVPRWALEDGVAFARMVEAGRFEIETASGALPETWVPVAGSILRFASPPAGADWRLRLEGLGGVSVRTQPLGSDLVHVVAVEAEGGRRRLTRLLHLDIEDGVQVGRLPDLPPGRWHLELRPLLRVPGEETSVITAGPFAVVAGAVVDLDL
jgi:hypothetical protein